MRAILLYLSLVGIPVLGVLGLLQVGQGLTPPISVGGIWIAELSPPAVDDPSCGGPLRRAHGLVVTISQSGTHLRLTFNDEQRTTLVGKLQDLNLTAEVPRQSAAPAATPANHEVAAIQVQARVERQTEIVRLSGGLTLNACSRGATIPFTATRQRGAHQTTGGQ